ncbi:hypothetical protein WA171_005899, partial [Blastocystis sp. BT1]
MECLFQGAMIPLLSGAFQCFSKLNSEVVLLCTPTELSFQVTGMALQSFLKLSIQKDAMGLYKCGNTFHFGVSTKALLTIFNDIKQIENVMMKTEQVDIEFNLVFELLCKPKVRKVFRIRYSDAVLNNVSFNPEKSPNHVYVRPDLLYKALQYLEANEEIVVKVFESSLSLENIPTEGEIRTVSNLAASDVDHISILSPTSFRFMKTGLEAVLQFMTMAELRVAQLQFGEGGGVLNVGVKPGNEREGVILEYLVATVSENEGDSLEAHIEVTAQQKRNNPEEAEKEEKRVEMEENDDEFWQRRQNDEEEW